MERIKGANGELMKYSMQPMDGDGHLTLYRYDQLAVGGADNAHLEFWQEIEELRKQRADAQATIAALQAQLKQRTAEIEAANKLLYKKNCALGRAETIINDLQAELERVRGELAKMRERKDGAYLERNCVVAALATCFPSGVARTAIEGWDEEWHGCVYIDLPVGQVSWHYHDSHAHLFAHLPAYTKPWDGHTTEEKYERVAMLQHRQGMEGQHGSR